MIVAESTFSFLFLSYLEHSSFEGPTWLSRAELYCVCFQRLKLKMGGFWDLTNFFPEWAKPNTEDGVHGDHGDFFGEHSGRLRRG